MEEIGGPINFLPRFYLAQTQKAAVMSSSLQSHMEAAALLHS